MTAASGPSPATSLPVDGKAAPPRTNGELVFAAPWESRVFGMTMALIEGGAIAWPEFQTELVAEARRVSGIEPGPAAQAGL